MALVRFAARDPGGANVLAAFLREWRPPAPHQVDVWTLPRATPVFNGLMGLDPRPLEEQQLQELPALWKDAPADLLVTGTSHYAPFESSLWRLARERGVPSLAVMDSWNNLDVRFRDGRPDFAGAVDRDQVPELVALGFPADRVLLSGHPFLAGLGGRREQPMAAGAATRVLFVSEPIAEDLARGANRPFGFDQVDAFAVVHAAALARARAGQVVDVAVKCHPYEEPERFTRALERFEVHEHLSVRVMARNEGATTAVAWAQLVCGIGSMLLLEAIAAGRPVVSVQPGLAREDTFIASRRGFVPLLTDPVNGPSTVANLLASSEDRARLLARNRQFLETVDRSHGREVARWLEERL